MGDDDDHDPPILEPQIDPLFTSASSRIFTTSKSLNENSTMPQTQSNPSTSTNTTSSLSRRARQYSHASKGPYTVVVREINKKLLPISMAKYINEAYKSTVLIKRSPGVLRITLDSVHDANRLALDESMANYHVSVPAHQVEVEGAVDWNDLCDLNDPAFLCEMGEGGFNNASLPSIRIIHAERLSRRDEVDDSFDKHRQSSF